MAVKPLEVIPVKQDIQEPSLEESHPQDTVQTEPKLKRKRIDEGKHDGRKPDKMPAQKDVAVLKAFGRELKKVVQEVDAPVSQPPTSRHASGSKNTSRRSSPRLDSRSPPRESAQDAGLEPKVPSPVAGGFIPVWRVQQTPAYTDPGLHAQYPIGMAYPNSEPQSFYPPNHPFGTAIPPHYPPPFSQQNHAFHPQAIPPGIFPYHPPVTHALPTPLPSPHQSQYPAYYVPWQNQPPLPPLHPQLPPLPNVQSAEVFASTAPGEDERLSSKTIEHYADILLEFMELQTKKAVSEAQANCQPKTKVDQGVQTDFPVPDVHTSEAGIQTEPEQ